jgi:hypothetical protein
MADDREILKQLSHHDAEIKSLGDRMGGVERGLGSLSQNVNHGFSDLSAKFERMNARPVIDLTKIVQTVFYIAVLFSMTLGGVIYVVQTQNAGMTQSLSSSSSDLKEMRSDITSLKEKFGWVARTDREH